MVQRSTPIHKETKDAAFYRVLLVEDDEEDYILVRDLLQEVQDGRFRLDWVKTCEEAEQAVLRKEHDVYLVDYRLNGRTGLELLSFAMANGCRAPLIMLTGFGDHEIDLKLLQSGAVDYLIKGQINSSLLSRSIRYSMERSKTLEALRLSEERFKRLANATLEGIVFLKEGVICDVNQAMADMFGYTIQEMTGMTPVELVHPEYRATVAAHVREKFPHPYEVIGLRKNGTSFPIEAYGRSFSMPDFEGRVTAIRDITERKKAIEAVRRSEEKYRAIFEQSHDAIFLTARDGRFLDANQSALNLLGQSRKDLLKLNYFDLFLMDAERKVFQHEIETLGSVKEFEVQFKKSNGTPLECLVTASLRKDAQEEILGYHGIIRDITERKRMEENMLHSQKLESLGVLAGGIAHDFNNLLMVIMGKAGIARKQLPAESPARQSLDHISTASQRAAELCKQMLAYAGKGRFEMRILNLNRIIDETLQLLNVSIAKGVDLKFVPQRDIPSVSGDATQIRQVVMNLVVNGSEAMGSKGGTITVTTGVIQATKDFFSDNHLSKNLPEGPYVYMEVTDTGCGMSPETQEKIFDPFFTTKFTGRGLGLAAVLGITKGHRGCLKIKSKLSEGTTFQFFLPAAVGKPVVEIKVDETDPWQGSGTVLVVDDEENVRVMTGQMLEMLGFGVILAKDGQEGLDLFKSKEIDLVLLDVTMPKMNGHELFREIRKLKPGTAILLMSGYNEEITVAELRGKARSGFLHKPFDFATLQGKLRAMLKS